MLDLKKGKCTDYNLSRKSNGVYNSKLKPLYTAFLDSKNLSGYKMGTKTLKKDPLVVEQKNYLTKILNVYVVYDLDSWLKTPLRNFAL